MEERINIGIYFTKITALKVVCLGLDGPRNTNTYSFASNIGIGPVKRNLFAYGGFFEDPAGVRHDGNFCMNGLIDSEQKPHPGLFAMKYLQRYSCNPLM